MLDEEDKKLLEDILLEEREDTEFEAIWGPGNSTKVFTCDDFNARMQATLDLMRKYENARK